LQRSTTASPFSTRRRRLRAPDGDDDDYSDRLLRGGRAKWADKVWTMDGTLLHEEDRFLVTGADFALQRFLDGIPEVIQKEPGKSLPDVEELK
jgi:hypothetical protein